MDLNSSFASRMVREELAEIKEEKEKKKIKSAGCASKIDRKVCKDEIFGDTEPEGSFWVWLACG